MLKEAIEKIAALSAPFVSEIEGKAFILAKDSADYKQVQPDFEFPKTLELYSLEALVQMLKTEAAEVFDAPFYVNAHAHDEVICYTRPLDALRNERAKLYLVRAKDVPGWDKDVQLSYEEAMIAIRTRFQETQDTEYLLRLLSEITCGASVKYANNGIATTIVTKHGVDLQSNAPIKPIVKLKPYRTFQEIDQPESEIHIRVKEQGIKFIEADGGMWKLAARHTIAEHLKEALADMIEAGNVIVTI